MIIETVFGDYSYLVNNAHVVLPDRIVYESLVITGRNIDKIDEGPYSGINGIDCNGDYLIPGLIELHTDNLEKYIVPRPGIYWPSMAASIVVHDYPIETYL